MEKKILTIVMGELKLLLEKYDDSVQNVWILNDIRIIISYCEGVLDTIELQDGDNI